MVRADYCDSYETANDLMSNRHTDSGEVAAPAGTKQGLARRISAMTVRRTVYRSLDVEALYWCSKTTATARPAAQDPR